MTEELKAKWLRLAEVAKQMADGAKMQANACPPEDPCWVDLDELSVLRPEWDYRLKPQPVECWAVVSPSGCVGFTGPSRELVFQWMKSRVDSVNWRIVKMREVGE